MEMQEIITIRANPGNQYKKMKAFIHLLIIWASICLNLSCAHAQESPHERPNEKFKNSGYCITCHFSRKSFAPPEMPLWYPRGAGQIFLSYDAATGLASDISQKCLSCHDGLNAADRFGGSSLLSKINAFPVTSKTGYGGDHPVSIPYKIKNGEYKNIIGNIAVKLFNGKVECATCHHPHINKNEKHLRISNTKSALCFTCHDK